MPRIVVSYLKENKIEPYLAALRAVGLAEEAIVRATPARTRETDLQRLMLDADGLLLTGGADLQPCLYGEARRPDAGLDPPAPERDQMEWDLLWHARAQAKPVFAICRGHQMAHVFLGGSLFQDLTLQAGARGHDAFLDRGFAPDLLVHRVGAESVSHPLARWIERFDRPWVNSRHHQGVKTAGRGLAVLARAEDGVVEASAWTGDAAGGGWWLQSVQWHPENLVHLPLHRGLFEQFLAATAEAGATRTQASVLR